MPLSFRPIKIRDEADACAMDLGVVAKGDIVKVLEVGVEGPYVFIISYVKSLRPVIEGWSTYFDHAWEGPPETC